MKKDELPQDKGDLENFTREVCYVKNKDGKYEKGLSTGWEAKQAALDNAWEEIERVVAQTKESVLNGKVSPIKYYMELQVMDMPVLAGYTGFWSWQIKRHLKPKVFAKLSPSKLEKYAKAFDITVNQLTEFK
ncbi:MAG: hypothetical protein COA33_009310 [Fluviicola sp.]|nr:hypothetical protein [Fluviicola sp.]